MTAADGADLLERAAAHVRRLRPDWRDAGAFYEARSEALGLLAAARAEALRRLAAAAVRPRRARRRVADDRQTVLPLAETLEHLRRC